jgi:hypothetical protein
MVQHRIHWASSSCKALVSLDTVLRVCVLEEAFAPTEFTRACHRRLREEAGLIVWREVLGCDPDLV